ncbi:hypothetical protein LTS12_025216, partial [Elasticomyces elasticus]
RLLQLGFVILAMSATKELPDFFSRNGLDQHDLTQCLDFVKARYPEHLYNVRSVLHQGGCSYSVLLEPRGNVDTPSTRIVQYRLQKHAVPLNLAIKASLICAPLAPRTRELGWLDIGHGQSVQGLEMSCIMGVRYNELKPRRPTLDTLTLTRLHTSIRSISDFFAMQWRAGERYQTILTGCTGFVGSSMLSRLESLARLLLTDKLRHSARRALAQIKEGALDVLPVVLTHGDLIPSNIHVSAKSWRVEGYVDWAEAEQLPFGLCLYGLEHLLGYTEKEGRTPRFAYYSQAEILRATFWNELEKEVPEVRSNDVRTAIGVARAAGLLLWHGFAFDDGKLDRVVNAVDDAEELELLEAHLGLRTSLSRHDSILDQHRSC